MSVAPVCALAVAGVVQLPVERACDPGPFSPLEQPPAQ
jgi:hypothetical protein